MTDDALLAAVLAAPDDDTPRLVYADWLEDAGDVEQAEFIRLHIEHHRRPRPELARRADDLLSRHKQTWEIPGIKGVQRFRRGFVERLEMAAADFIAHAERIGATAPVVELRLPLATEHLGALATIPWLSRLEALDLTGNIGIAGWLSQMVDSLRPTEAVTGGSFTTRLITSLFDGQLLGRLRDLALRNNQFWPSDIPALAGIVATLPRLEALNLSGNPIGDDGIRQLSTLPAFKNLRELVLRCDEQPYVDAIHGVGAAAIARSRVLTNLHSLDLGGHYIGDAGLIDIATAPSLAKLESLDVSYNEIGSLGGDSIETLAEYDRLPRLKSLCLDGNRVDRAALQALLARMAKRPLERLSLLDCFEGWDPSPLIEESPHVERIEFDRPTVAA
jgi:uncharacterized protein (TIGR02996 family)